MSQRGINGKARRVETAEADEDQFCVIAQPAAQREGDRGWNPRDLPVAHQGT